MQLEKILEEIREMGDIQFASYTKPLIAVEDVEKIIRKHMSGKDTDVPTNDGWIPVEERLPEVGEYVLGTNEYDEVLIYHYGWNSPHTRKMFFRLCGAAATIIAWRPLPEPYRPERSEK